MNQDIHMNFQKRDSDILNATYDFDGVIAKRQIKQIFWKDKSPRAMEKRLSKLYQGKYINWPSLDQRRTYPIPEPVIWLNWKGALHLAGQQGINLEPPEKENENHFRMLERKLRNEGFHWLREPRWSQLKHDLAVIDTRLWIQSSGQQSGGLTVEEWIKESSFRSDMDYIDFQVKDPNGETITKRRGICPDGYFCVIDEKRKESGEPFRARFLMEMDLATHDNPSFGIEKAAAGAAYIKSEEYRKRFDTNSGRWLVITTGVRRMKNLMSQTRDKALSNSGLFFFTLLENKEKMNFFSSPIWFQVGRASPAPLL